MMDTNRMAEHPEEGALVRFLDRQVAPDERRRLMAHLSACEECTARLEQLSERSDALSRVVGELDIEGAPDELTRARALSAARRAQARRAARPTWYSSAGLRAAAVAMIAALVTLGVEPLRAWVVERWDDLVGGEQMAPAEVMQPGVLERGSVVSFEPASETFVLELEHAQIAGSVTLELRDVEQASAQVVNGRTEEILALPSGLRVENSSASTASYTFTLPTDLRLIQVFADGRPIAIIPLEDVRLPWTRTVPLGPAASR